MSSRILIVSACLIAALVAGAASADAQTTGTLDSKDSTLLSVAEMVVQLGRDFHDSIWPGYDLSNLPMILYIPDRWALLLNAPQQVEDFADYPASWPDLTTHALYRPGQFETLIGQLGFNISVGSIKVAAVGYDGESPLRALEYVIHENFHQYQFTNFGTIPWAREEIYPIESSDNTSLACLEMHILADAVRSLRESDLQALRDQAGRFVAVRQHRWSQATPYLREYEQGLELKEGTAKYVEMKAVSMLPRLSPASASESQTSPFVMSLDSVALADCIIDDLEEVITDGTIAPEDVARNRVYPVGAALGCILDDLEVEWKPMAQTAGSEFNFADLIIDALSLDTTLFPRLLEDAKASYEYDSILRSTQRSIELYRAGFDSAMTAFASQPGRRVEFRCPASGVSRSRRSDSRKWLVEHGSKELRSHFGVYTLKGISDPGFWFQLKDAGLLELNDWENRIKHVVFYCRSVDSLSVDGTPMSTDRDRELRFESLFLGGERFEIRSDRPGVASISKDVISIDLVP